MILRLEMPSFDLAVKSVRILRWYKREGDFIGYGDTICDVLVEEVARLKRLSDARALQRSAPTTVDYFVRSKDVAYRVRVLASDQGRLRAIRSPEGQQTDVGSILALVTTEADEPLTEIDGSAPAFRVVSDLLASNPQEDQES